MTQTKVPSSHSVHRSSDKDLLFLSLSLELTAVSLIKCATYLKTCTGHNFARGQKLAKGIKAPNIQGGGKQALQRGIHESSNKKVTFLPSHKIKQQMVSAVLTEVDVC